MKKIEQSSELNEFFWFSSAYESYIDTILNSIKFIVSIVLCLKKDVHTLIKSYFIAGDFPGGPVVKNRPCSPGDAGLIPGQEMKIPYALEHLNPKRCNCWAHVLQSPQAANAEPMHSNYWRLHASARVHALKQKFPHDNKDPVCCN